MDLREAYRLEQQLMATQIEVVRATLTHGGEKGRVLESYVHRFLRDALPREYGITTGFIAFPPDAPGREPTLSSQLDIIIYDALRGSPLVRLPTCDVLPLEAVMAYVEVKAGIDATELRRCAQEAYEVRRHLTRWFWSNQGPNEAAPVGLLNCIATRSYVFAFEGPKSPDTVQRALREAKEQIHPLAEFSGVFINGCGLFQSAPMSEPIAPEVALARFRNAVLHGLARFPRYAPSLRRGPHGQPSSADYAHEVMQGMINPPEFIDANGEPSVVMDILELTAPYLDHYAKLGPEAVSSEV
jgi:hypothetical protein